MLGRTYGKPPPKSSISTVFQRLDMDVCNRVMPGGDRRLCQDLEQSPITNLTNAKCEWQIPKQVFTVGKDHEPPLPIRSFLHEAHPDYRLVHRDDQEALEYIRQHLGRKTSEAYRCLAAPAFRADLYRFCVLFEEGGIYMDADLVPIVPLERFVHPCKLTLGHDYPMSAVRGSKQQKLLAAPPGERLFRCMIDAIVDNVEQRRTPRNPLEFSGPHLLQKCYEQVQPDAAFTHFDTRAARWPFSGLRTRDELLLFETPPARRNFKDRSEDPNDYNNVVASRGVYRADCAIGHNSTRADATLQAMVRRLGELRRLRRGRETDPFDKKISRRLKWNRA